MPTWDEIKKINFRKMKKDPAWRAERMGFVKPAPRHAVPNIQQVRKMRDSTKRRRAAAQSLRDRGL